MQLRSVGSTSSETNSSMPPCSSIIRHTVTAVSALSTAFFALTSRMYYRSIGTSLCSVERDCQLDAENSKMLSYSIAGLILSGAICYASVYWKRKAVKLFVENK